MRMLPLLGLLLLFSTQAVASEILRDHWQVEFVSEGVNSERIVSSPLEFKWNQTPQIVNDHARVNYSRRFIWSEDLKVPRQLYLIIPASWVPYRITINDVLVLDQFSEKSDVKSRIYAPAYTAFHNSILKYENVIRIESYGNKLLGGFRGDSIIISDDTNMLRRVKLTEFFHNGIYSFFIALSLVLAVIFICLSIFFRVFGIHYGFIGLASLMILPHHLLTSDLYSVIFRSQDSLFKFHQFFQTIAWPSVAVYCLSDLVIFRAMLQKFKGKRWVWGLILSVYGTVAFLAVVCPLKIFAGYIAPIFFISIVIAVPVTIYLNRRNTLIFLMTTVGYLVCLATVVSEFTTLNWYFLGYGSSLFSVSGFYFLFRDFVKFYRLGVSSVKMLETSVPNSVSFAIEPLLKLGASVPSIRSSVKGNAHLVTVFIDLISWGKMGRMLTAEFINDAKELCFSLVGEILEPYGIEFIKPMGDSAHFCAGLPFSKNRVSINEMAANTLYAVVKLLDSIDEINLKLKELQYPRMKMKISVAYGLCSFGFEGSQGKVRFDTAGDSVNIAARFEQSMRADFYKKYGENVAMVSEELINLGLKRASDILGRFSESYEVKDKHDIVYQSRIARQYAIVDPEGSKRILEAALGAFSHQETSSGFFQDEAKTEAVKSSDPQGEGGTDPEKK